MTANSSCLSCGYGMAGCGNCTYDDGAQGALPYNSSLFTCLECDNLAGYYNDFKHGRCLSICGDGIVVTASEACDDNNTADYDGCSSKCLVETGYTCSGSPSVCIFASLVSVNLQSQAKSSVVCNTITLQFILSPASATFAQPYIVWDNFLITPNSSIIVQNTSMLSYNSGVLTASYFLLQNVQNQTLIFEPDFTSLILGSPRFSNTSAAPITVVVSTTPEALMACCTGYFVNINRKTC
jgi:cysteine-rich repeat protein